MHTLLGSYLRFLHNLAHHRLFGATLHRWLAILLPLIAVLAWFDLLPGGSALTLSLVALVIALVYSQIWAKRNFFVHFAPAPPLELNNDAPPLTPSDKIATRATGIFAVDDQQAPFTNLPAFYRTYATREHAILARKTPTRFLGLTEADPRLLGMWYIFITPAVLRSVQSGLLYSGSPPHPALRLSYIRPNKKGQPIPAIVYLDFDTEGDRSRVQADLLLDLA